MLQYYPTQVEKEAINLVKDEVNEWKEGTVFVTDTVSYQMKGIIDTARRNYLGKFLVEKDEITGRKKHFVPLTEDMVETVVKNIDLDSADINIRATNPNGFASATIIRYLISYFMRKNYFGEILNSALRLFAIDGTVVLKSLRVLDPSLKKQVISSRIVDRRNFFIDLTEDNIQSAGAVIERNILTLSQAKKFPWDNKQFLEGRTDVSILDIDKPNKTYVPYTEVHERWGEIPKYLITENVEDKKIWIPGIIIVSNLGGNTICHKIIENKKGTKPYEECRFRKIFGRWDGRGIGEILQSLQIYLNENANRRINSARIAQLGLWKVKKGSGITQQLLTSLISGGAIPVNRMDDIQELRTSEIKESSYREEENTYNWAQKATQAFNISKGEALPASQPATTAVLQERGSRTGYDLLQENLGMFLSRLFERHLIPLILETITDKEIISIIGSPKELKEIDNAFINKQINKHILDYYIKNHSFPNPKGLEILRKTYQGNLDKFHKTRYFSINKKLLENYKYEVEVFVTGESFNKVVVVKQLNEMLMAYSKIPGINLDTDAVFREILDLMGLGGARFLKKADETASAPLPVSQMGATQAPRRRLTPPRQMEETESVGEAATLERMGK